MARHGHQQRSRRVRYTDDANPAPVVRWLRAGAVAAGLGAALAIGGGVASADTDGGQSSSVGASESSSGASNDTPGTASEPVGATQLQTPETTSLHDGGDTDVAESRPARLRIRTSVSAQGTVRTPSSPAASAETDESLAPDTPPAEEPALETSPIEEPADPIPVVPVVPAVPEQLDSDTVIADQAASGTADESPEPQGTSGTRFDIASLLTSITEELATATTVGVTSAGDVSAIVDEAADATPVAAPTAATTGAATTAADTGPSYPDAITAPVTWRAVASDVLRWFGLPPLSAESPIPPLAVPAPLDMLWIALRRFEYRYFNDRPTAQPSQTSQDITTGIVTGSLNAVDADGDQLTYTVVGTPDNGTVVINADGTYVYTPTSALAHAGGTDTFTVLISDTVGNPWHVHGLAGALGLTKPQTVAVTITVTPIVNGNPTLPPVVAPGPDSEGRVTGTVGGVDPNGDPLTYSVETGPANGTVVIASDGTYVYTPSATAQHAAAADGASTATKTDSFTVMVSDAYGGTAVTTVSVMIKPTNAIPTAAPVIEMHDNTEIVTEQYLGSDGFFWTKFAGINVLKITPNVTDADGDAVVVTVTNENPATGSVVALGDGTFLYVPAAATLGAVVLHADNVIITVTDGHGGVHTQTEVVEFASGFRLDGVGTAIGVTIGGSGTSAGDPQGAPLDLDNGLSIGGGSYGLGLDEGGTQLEVTGLNGGPSYFVPVVTDQGDVPWSVSETDTTTAIYANGRLALFFYLGPV